MKASKRASDDDDKVLSFVLPSLNFFDRHEIDENCEFIFIIKAFIAVARCG